MSSTLRECPACLVLVPLSAAPAHTCRPANLLRAASLAYAQRGRPGDEWVAGWLESHTGQVSEFAAMPSSVAELSSCDEPGATWDALVIARAVTGGRS